VSRAIAEWIGKSDDDRPPGRVRARIFAAHAGVCHVSKRKIRAGEPWDADHIVALCNGGENRESNMAPALRDKHREKTARDVAEKSRMARKVNKHIGIRKPSRMPGSRDSRWRKKLDGTVVLR
jgi:5-methylcytosine-specific restriction protein A